MKIWVGLLLTIIWVTTITLTMHFAVYDKIKFKPNLEAIPTYQEIQIPTYRPDIILTNKPSINDILSPKKV